MKTIREIPNPRSNKDTNKAHEETKKNQSVAVRSCANMEPLEVLIIVVLVILIYSAIVAVVFGLCFLLNWVLGPPAKEEKDVESGHRNTKV